MKKNLFAIGLLSLSISMSQAQVLTYMGDTSLMHISKGTLYYNGGGMKTVATGKVENHGNIMIEGSNTDVFETKQTGGAIDKTDGGNFVLKLNEPGNYADAPSPGSAIPSTFTYGQLSISGIPQNQITGYVDKEYRNVAHGDYQQIGLPFYDKTLSTLNSELGKTFNNNRFSGNEILVWNNQNVVFDNLGSLSSQKTSVPGSYYILGAKNNSLDLQSVTRVLEGMPYSDETAPNSKLLKDAGNGINFGTNGNNTNAYNERYNSYLQDAFAVSIDGGAWGANFGRNLYQFSNPFFTNLDLSNLFTDIPNLYGIRLEVSGVQYTPNAGGGSTSFKFVTNNSGVAVGDTDYLLIRPLGTFVLKLRDNSANTTINLANYRRFADYKGSTGLSTFSLLGGNNLNLKTASLSKGVKSSGTVKELAIVGLDQNGNELERTYYVVSPNSVTGYSPDINSQVVLSGGSSFGTYEENINGGYDNDHASYWLYINEANESNFTGKNIKLVNYNPNIKSVKFFIKENGEKLDTGVENLSTGLSFYYNTANGVAKSIKNEAVIPVQMNSNNTAEFDIYYGAPNNGTLGIDENVLKGNKTQVLYDVAQKEYKVKFASNWKTASIAVYDMSGKLVKSANNVNAKEDYLVSGLVKNAVYIVKVTSETGEVVSSKIIIK
ncbi:T9SS type A sorting domain-containing protein [Elizabethkingia sp. JS20170427COW]|uniref:T9SS type A sorting domain-containing protein n=1 Tax=Elizabethkingia sp. JS20170427COW TaxID=2583851 RepID=UPI0011104917|nr:T9SS type A sorting domain-containing protein [Elizabethkingia sp. JS20170427COW]QCX53527.1 T9SS type A sorting domain-containing protein [Elizabethkingia sp. JS20170427COW]